MCAYDKAYTGLSVSVTVTVTVTEVEIWGDGGAPRAEDTCE